jgi:hypothetical protein
MSFFISTFAVNNSIMIDALLSMFSKKQQSNSDITQKLATKVTYPFEGYENLSLGERYKVIRQGMLENKVFMKK